MNIEVNNIRIHYTAEGEGHPIILLNPNSKSTRLMTFIAKRLKEKYKVYTLDRRGCGKSEKNCTLTYDETARDVYEFIKKLNLDKPYLLGCSGGGTAALYVAVNYPQSISKLILCSAVADNSVIKKPAYAEFMEKLPWYPGKTVNERFEKLLSEDNSVTQSELNSITVPTLIFNGGAKDIVPKSQAEYINDNIKNSHLYILNNGGHCSYVINDSFFYDKLFDFLA